jgi:cytochrome c-type biogenesis protein CcmH
MAQGQSLQGKPEALIKRALQIDGNNLKALALAGTAEFENNNFDKAIEYWGRMLPLLAADSEMGNSVRASIQEAQAKQGGMPKSSTQIAQNKQEGEGAPKASPAGDAAKAKGVSGTVKLAPALAARAHRRYGVRASAAGTGRAHAACGRPGQGQGPALDVFVR